MTHQCTFRRSALLAVLAAALMVLAACGGGADETAVSEPTDAASPEAETGGEGSGLATLTDSDCRQYAQAFEDVPSIADPDSLDSIGQLADVLDDAADRVPNEISDDFRVLADAYREFSATMGSLNVDFTDPDSMAALGPEELAALQQAGEAFSSPEFEEAARNIEAFVRENCT